MIFGPEPTARVNFSITQKKIEWIDAAGKNVAEFLRDKTKFIKTSYCRQCKTKLIWGDGSYNFDHKDNNPRNNSQKNCYLVCRNCHGKATKIGKRAITGIFGQVVGYQTIKRKVSYKKPKATSTKKKVTKKRVAKRVPKKVASRTKKSKSVKRARAKRSRK
jgi:hypothetical protein